MSLYIWEIVHVCQLAACTSSSSHWIAGPSNCLELADITFNSTPPLPSPISPPTPSVVMETVVQKSSLAVTPAIGEQPWSPITSTKHSTNQNIFPYSKSGGTLFYHGPSTLCTDYSWIQHHIKLLHWGFPSSQAPVEEEEASA